MTIQTPFFQSLNSGAGNNGLPFTIGAKKETYIFCYKQVKNQRFVWPVRDDFLARRPQNPLLQAGDWQSKTGRFFSLAQKNDKWFTRLITPKTVALAWVSTTNEHLPFLAEGLKASGFC